MKKLLLLVATFLVLGAPMAAFSTPEKGDRSFTISGTGASDEDFNENSYGVSAELGYYSTDHLLWGVRQSVSGVSGDDVENAWSGATRGFVDYHFLDGNWRPFIGLNLGGIYGEGVKNTGTAGVETGLKYFVLEKTFINFGLEYSFLFDDTDEIDNKSNDGSFVYTLGVGFNF